MMENRMKHEKHETKVKARVVRRLSGLVYHRIPAYTLINNGGYVHAVGNVAWYRLKNGNRGVQRND